VLKSEAKKRKESIELYIKGKRDDLAKKEEEELAVLKEYLPAELSDQEIQEIVVQAIESVKPEGIKDFGKVMSEAMRLCGGKADGAVVGKLVKEKLDV